MPLWASLLRDFDILNIFYDKLKIEKMATFEILIATNGLSIKCKISFHPMNNEIKGEKHDWLLTHH